MRSVLIMLFLTVFRSCVHAFRVPSLARSVLRVHTGSSKSVLSRSLSTLQIEPLVVDNKIEIEHVELDNVLHKRVKRGKIRQHVNPLTTAHSKPLQLNMDWMNTAFPKIGPGEFIVDIGCARGSWAMEMCKRDENINIVGLEIRIPMVELCLERKQNEDIRNVHFLKSNANVDLDNIFTSLSAKDICVNTVTIQFPDPHFKVKHKKRRVVNASLVRTIAKNLQVGARVFLQTDIEELGYDMVSHFVGSEHFTPAVDYNAEALHTNNPIYEVQTEREICTLRDSKPVYRMLFYRNNVKL